MHKPSTLREIIRNFISKNYNFLKESYLYEQLTINDVRGLIKKTILNEASAVASAPTQTTEPGTSSSQSAIADRILVADIKDGDEEAMQQIMNKYKKNLYSFVMKMVHDKDTEFKKRSQRMEDEAEDVVMITFEKAFRNIEKYDPDYAFSTWLYRIAKNTMIDHVRKWKNNTTISYHKPNEHGESTETNIADKEMNPFQKMEKEEKYSAVRAAIDRMNPKYGKFLKLQYFDGLSYEEIAKKTKLPLPTVKTAIFRAKQQLADELKHGGINLNEQRK